MKLLLLTVIMAVVLGGCVYAKYGGTPKTGQENFKLISVMKSVDGLSAGRVGKDFKIDIDETHSKDPSANLLEIIKIIYGIPAPATPPDGD